MSASSSLNSSRLLGRDFVPVLGSGSSGRGNTGFLENPVVGAGKAAPVVLSPAAAPPLGDPTITDTSPLMVAEHAAVAAGDEVAPPRVVSEPVGEPASGNGSRSSFLE